MATLLLAVILLRHADTVTNSGSAVVTEPSDASRTAVQATDCTAAFLPGTVVNVTADDVERHLRLNDVVVVDVRSVREVDECGLIPTAHLLPGDRTGRMGERASAGTLAQLYGP